MTPELMAAIIALLGALTAYIKSHSEVSSIKTDRSETKIERDKDSNDLHDRITRLECTSNTHRNMLDRQQSQLEKNNNQLFIFNKQLTEVVVKMDNIIESLRDLRNEVKGK